MSLLPADPTVLHPMPGQPRVVLLKPLVTSPLIEVGEYSYYDDPDDPTAFETRNVLYHYGPEKLVIGRSARWATGRAVHHERRQPPHGRPLHLPVPHHGRLLGRPLRPAHRAARPGRHRGRQRRLVRLPGDGDAGRPDRERRDHRRRFRRHLDDVPDYGIVGGNPAEAASAPATTTRTSPASSRWPGGTGRPSTSPRTSARSCPAASTPWRRRRLSPAEPAGAPRPPPYGSRGPSGRTCGARPGRRPAAPSGGGRPNRVPGP